VCDVKGRRDEKGTKGRNAVEMMKERRDAGEVQNTYF
jgi:hypothetical protein